MESSSKKALKKIPKLNAAEIKKAFMWIDSLPEKEIAKLTQFVAVQVAQLLLKKYLKQPSKKFKKKKRGVDK